MPTGVYPRPATFQNFVSKVDVDPLGCWGWKGGMYANGYCSFAVDRRAGLAHRYAYEQFVGPIPDGLTIDHLCRNPGCVNPDHLEAVSHRENTLRSDNPAAMNARKTHCKNGHEFTVENTYIATNQPNPRRQCRICRRESVRAHQQRKALTCQR